VFYVALAISLVFVLWGAFFPENLSSVTSAVLGYVVASFGWVFLVATLAFLVFVVFLAFSRYGSIRLGKDDDRPEFRTISWFAMLFSAGMGIGLVFFGVGEPISHFASPPFGMAEPESVEAARLGMQYSFFHWGLHPWAIYAVIAMAIAYFSFRKGRPVLISSAFYPLLGDRVDGPIGKSIDVLAILATLFGVATSLGLGALQINSGLSYLFEVPNTNTVAVVVIVVVTALFVISAVSGLNRGILYLSNTNMILAGGLLLFLLIVGPTVFMINSFVATLGNYMGAFIDMSFTSGAFERESEWLTSWTLFYWAWWISWAPFVGMFIARISKGRTIREFVAGVLLAPTLLSFIWFSVLGGAALNLDLARGQDIAAAVSEDVAVGLFATLGAFSLGFIMSVMAILLIGTFFITSADSASFVLGSLSSKGAYNPGAVVKVIWGSLAAAVAIVLLLSGGLSGVQTAAILAAVPFTLVMIGICVSLYKSLSEEPVPARQWLPAGRRERMVGEEADATRGTKSG
jgi:glycine betaine transporter